MHVAIIIANVQLLHHLGKYMYIVHIYSDDLKKKKADIQSLASMFVCVCYSFLKCTLSYVCTCSGSLRHISICGP